ncbi:MAG: DUF2191 domain-containing protein [Deltaproteobacteria bacterium]|nr:MAG: DUF2191 domain-containing protein [Deltaproteobacteria bacterium]
MVENNILEKAMVMAGIKEQSSLVSLSLKSLIACKSSDRLALIGGNEKKIYK